MTVKTKNRFSGHFSTCYVCDGDTISADIDGFHIVARIERDNNYKIDDDDCHSPDQSVTGCDDNQQAKLLAARQAWFDDEWWYVGVVLSVSRNDIELDSYAASLWGIEANYPAECAGDDSRSPNEYLTDVANDLIDEALAAGERARQSQLLALRDTNKQCCECCGQAIQRPR